MYVWMYGWVDGGMDVGVGGSVRSSRDALVMCMGWYGMGWDVYGVLYCTVLCGAIGIWVCSVV